MAGSGGPDHKDVLGSAMVLVGLAFFVVVFVVIFPVLTNPAGAYDRWFPSEAVEISEQAEPTGEPAAAGPTAQFRWENVAIEAVNPPLYRMRLTSETLPGDAEIVAVRWELGDGNTAIGESVTHDYAAIDSYTIRISVEDANGQVDSVSGTVSVAESTSIFGSAGQVEDILDFDRTLDNFGDGITTSLEDAVGDVGDDITSTLDSALGSIGTTVRGGVVVALFALASLAATVVAWRIARIGVMLLVRDTDQNVRDPDRNVRRPAASEPQDETVSSPRRGLEAV